MIPDQLRAFLSGQIDRLQATYPPNRLVALLLVALGLPAAAIGGYVAVWVPKHFPGAPTFTAGQYTGFFLAGVGVVALQAATMAYRFIDGVQTDEEHVTSLADAAVTRDHVEHLEAMRLESAERIAIVEKAHTAEHAAELLGVPVESQAAEVTQGGPSEAVAAAVPPPVGKPDPLPPIPVSEPETGARGQGPGPVGVPGEPPQPGEPGQVGGVTLAPKPGNAGNVPDPGQL